MNSAINALPNDVGKIFVEHFFSVKTKQVYFFFFTLVTGPRKSLSLKLSDTRVYEPQIRARLGTTAQVYAFSLSQFPRASRRDQTVGFEDFCGAEILGAT